MDRLMDFIAQVFCVILVFGVFGFIVTITAIALAGPQIQKLFIGLPW